MRAEAGLALPYLSRYPDQASSHTLAGQSPMRIWRLNWGEVSDDRPPWSPVSGRLFAIWPSPVDHDVCFEAAGFADFGDSDDAWHDDFDDLVRRLVDSLYPVQGSSARRSVREALVAAARDDNGPPCVVHCGEPRTASIRTSNGHAVLWIWMADGGIGRILAAVAQGREVNQTTMKWEKLA